MTQLSFDGAGEGSNAVLIYCDGGSRGNPGPAAIGAVVLDPSTEPPTRIATVSETIGVTTNNVAEYKALIAGLEAAAPLRARAVQVRADSLLMIRQVAGEYKVRQAHLRPLHARVRELLQPYESIDLQHVPREENVDADALVNAALDAAAPAMILWLAFGAIFGVWNVFQSSGLDFRLVAIGSFAPLAIDALYGEQSYAHTLLSAVVLLLIAMVATLGRGRRLRRRRALSFVIGWFAGLVLSGAWLHKEVFWWPAFGTERPGAPLLPPLPVLLALEVAGLAAGAWIWARFGLGDASRRAHFLRRGHLAVVGEPR